MEAMKHNIYKIFKYAMPNHNIPIVTAIILVLFCLQVLTTDSNYIVVDSMDHTGQEVEIKEEKLKQTNNNPDEYREFLNYYLDIINIKSLLSKFPLSKNEYDAELAYVIVNEATKNGLDPYLIVSIIKTESSFRTNVVSNKGAVGLMQLLPKTAHYISEKRDHLDLENNKQLFDPIINIKIGINYLAYLRNKFNGNLRFSIIAYNIGPANLFRKLRENRRLPVVYYNKVMSNYDQIMLYSNRV